VFTCPTHLVVVVVIGGAGVAYSLQRLCYGLDDRHSILGGGSGGIPAQGPTQRPIKWALGVLSPRVKRPGHEADHSPPSSAEVNNAMSCISTPLVSLQ
jgi:hypothetical protein